MKLTLVKKCQVPVSRGFIQRWFDFLVQEFSQKRVRRKSLLDCGHVTLVFMGREEAKSLNEQYRSRCHATDVLSFEGDGHRELGDLVICWPILKEQAKKNRLKIQEELVYLLTHGVLHLLGYDHEKNLKEEKIMMRLQNEVFDRRYEVMK